MRKFMAVLLCCLLCLSLFTGCGSQISFTWTVDHVPQNLDPQLAHSGPELMAVYNLYSGLVRLDQNGIPQPECAESWEISSDGLTYTFHLKPELSYQKLKHHEKEYAVTADDFVFAFQRIFDPNTRSPYTSVFSRIENSQSVLQGAAPAYELGVSAPNPYTVEFRLSKPDSYFLENLALPGAMPCNQEFFENTQGAYGLTGRGSISVNILANGPFRLYNWNEHGLFLRRPSRGHQVSSLRMVLNATGSPATDENPEIPPLTGAALISEGKATAALSNEVDVPGYHSISYTDTTWVLAFNQKHPLLAQPQIRQALACCAMAANPRLPAGGIAPEGLVPPAISLDGRPYRELAGSTMPSFSNAAELCRQGLAAAGTNRFQGISILMPEGHGCLPVAEQLNQQWQKELNAFSAYFSLKELPEDEFEAALRRGDYQIAIVPLEPLSSSVSEFMNQIRITHPSKEILSILDQLDQIGVHQVSKLADFETMILDSALVLPLWHQKRSLLVLSDVSGLVFRPFGPILDLTWAERKV